MENPTKVLDLFMLIYWNGERSMASWVFEASPMQGEIEREIELIIAAIRDHLQE